jgi:Uma2 family endonuclease
MALPHSDVERRERLLTRAEYEDLVRRGVFDDAKVELLYGRVVSMSPQGDPHRISVRRLARILIRALGDRAAVDIQASYAASDVSKPEPDIVVLPPGDDVEGPQQRAWLVVEVADSSISRDRDVKSRLYAAALVPEYWIVNLVDEVVEVHRGPEHDGYASVTRHARGETLVVPGFEDVTVGVADVLPPLRRV